MSSRNRFSDDNVTLAERVVQAICSRISTRTLAPGMKLPSIRRFAATMQVSNSTVVEAYDRLVAEGIIHSRRGSGFYVAAHQLPSSSSLLGPHLDRVIDPLWISRQSMDAADDTLIPGCGWLPPSWMPEDGIRRALRTVARADNSVLAGYGTPLGLPTLRHLLARRMRESGIEAAPNQILLTESGTQAIDLVCRLLLEPGDTVLVDDPCYFNFLAVLSAHRAKVVSVPYSRTGPDLILFERALAEHRPRLYITNSTLHNPTGASLSPFVAHRILKLADQAALTIIEDDIFSDFAPEAVPRLAALDGLRRVIHIGSFSKTLSAAVRCGFIAARPDWIEGLVDLRIATSFGGGCLSAELVLSLLKDGSYRKHVESLRIRLARSMCETSARLHALGMTAWVEPKGGMFLWCVLPEGLDATDIARRALVDNIVLAPGNAFSPSQTAGRFLRFNVARSSDPLIFKTLEKLFNSAS